MEDLDFSHHVSEIPAGETLPRPYQRSVEANVTPFSGMQEAVSNYADASNWMSFIGSHVAAAASNSIATQLGSELGKKPQGNLGPTLTDFDKTMKESYNTQAQATLGLQADKLITDSNIQMSKAPRLTPQLIEKTNQNISLGLKNIFKNAPTEVQPSLQNQYGHQQLAQLQDLSSRMFREQREDTRNNTAMATQMNSEHAYSFGVRGNDKAAQEVLETTKKLNDAAAASHSITPLEAKTNNDTARINYLSGKAVHDYEAAKAAGKGEEYLKSIADKKPSYLSDNDYASVTNNLMGYVNHQDAMRSQDEQLRLSTFKVGLAQNPMSADMPSQLQNLQNNVSPDAFQKAKFEYVEAVKAFTKQKKDVNDAVAVWNSPSGLARMPADAIDKAFDAQVNNRMQQTTSPYRPVSRDDAEVEVALSAGAPVPVFTKALNNKLTSGNPADIESASAQITALRSVEGGHALSGLSKQADAIATIYQHKKGTMPDADLAREVTDNILNISDDMRKALDNGWNLQLSTHGAGGLGASQSLPNFALKEVGLSKSDFGGNQSFATVYGNDIYDQLRSNFDVTRGDYKAAKQMTQNYVDEHYGDTWINGGTQISDKPIEKTLGYKSRDVVPYIQQDLLSQLDSKFKENKNDNEYWTTTPVQTQHPKTFSTQFSRNYGPAEVVRHVKTANGEQQFRYPVMLVGRPGNSWDVVLNTPNGPRNIFLVAPHQGVIDYVPNAQSIRDNYVNKR